MCRDRVPAGSFVGGLCAVLACQGAAPATHRTPHTLYWPHTVGTEPFTLSTSLLTTRETRNSPLAIHSPLARHHGRTTHHSLLTHYSLSTHHVLTTHTSNPPGPLHLLRREYGHPGSCPPPPPRGPRARDHPGAAQQGVALCNPNPGTLTLSCSLPLPYPYP